MQHDRLREIDQSFINFERSSLFLLKVLWPMFRFRIMGGSCCVSNFWVAHVASFFGVGRVACHVSPWRLDPKFREFPEFVNFRENGRFLNLTYHHREKRESAEFANFHDFWRFVCHMVIRWEKRLAGMEPTLVVEGASTHQDRNVTFFGYMLVQKWPKFATGGGVSWDSVSAVSAVWPSWSSGTPETVDFCRNGWFRDFWRFGGLTPFFAFFAISRNSPNSVDPGLIKFHGFPEFAKFGVQAASRVWRSDGVMSSISSKPNLIRQGSIHGSL